VRVRVEGRGLTTLTLDVATDVGTFGADVGPPPPADVGTSGANAGGGGGDVARPPWEGTLATYVAVVPPSHLKGPLLPGGGTRGLGPPPRTNEIGPNLGPGVQVWKKGGEHQGLVWVGCWYCFAPNEKAARLENVQR
jgi:hypothetical protein